MLASFLVLTTWAAPIPPTESDLRAAIAQGGEITFTQDGTILLTNQIEVRTNCVISGAGLNIIIDGGNSNRLFHVSRGVQLELRNLTLQNARHAPPTLVAPDEPRVPGITATPARGGAVLNEGLLTITDSTLQNCAALGGSADLGDSFVTSPSEAGSGRGGAIFNRRGTLVMQNVFITNSVVYGGRVFRAYLEPVPRGLASGGAIFNEHGFLHLTNVTFASNAATHSGFGFPSRGFATGGAIASSGGTNTITRSVFVKNEAEPPGTAPDGVGMLTTGGAIHQEEGHSYSTSAHSILTHYSAVAQRG